MKNLHKTEASQVPVCLFEYGVRIDIVQFSIKIMFIKLTFNFTSIILSI